LGDLGTLCQTGVPLQRRGGELGELVKMLPLVDPPHISRIAGARDLKFFVLRAGVPKENCGKVRRTGVGSRDLLLILWTRRVSRMAEAGDISARSVCARCILSSLCQITLASCFSLSQ